MEGPGMSLFQGAASIHLNNSAQDRLEEQEELEDQKRRNEELKHKFANAFDDLMDDDEASSVNSSGNFTIDNIPNNGLQPRVGRPPTYIESLSHLKELTSESPKYCETPKNHLTQGLCDTPTGHMAHGHCETPKGHMAHGHHQEEPVKLQFSPYGAGDGQNNYLLQQELRGHINGINNYDARQEYMNHEQLKVMYEMRVKECQHLASQMEKLDTEIEGLRARLAATINDRDKAELSLQEAHHLLGAEKLVQHFKIKGVPIALATSSSQESVQMKMQNHKDFLALFDHLVMGSSDPEVTRGKPDPVIFLVCASRFPDKPRPENCLVFEDAVNGLKAANAANMQVVVVPDPRIDTAELASATLVLKSLEEFRPELFGLPPYHMN